MTETLWRCPNCGGEMTRLLPVDLEPIFTLRQAASLLNISEASLRRWLTKAPEIPRRYRQDSSRRRIRLLYGSEIRYLRDGAVKVYKDGKLRPQRQLLGAIEWTRQYPTIKRPARPVRSPKEASVEAKGTSQAD